MNNTSTVCNWSSSDCEEDDFQPGFSTERDVFPIFLSIFIILINSFVLFLVYKKKALRTVTNYILCSLAVSDLLTGILSIPSWLACNSTWHNDVCRMAEIMLRITSISTVLHLLVVTVDRYLAIIYSLRYHSLVTKKRAYVLLAIIWSISFFVSLIQLAWLKNTNVIDERPQSVREKELVYDILSVVFFFAIPLIVMIVTYSCIFFEVLRQSRNIKKNSVPGCLENRQQTRHEWKAALMFAVMLALFAVCWLSYFIGRIQQNLPDKFVYHLPNVVEYLLVMFRFLTSFINPCLYIFGKHDFRKALSKVFGWKRRPSRAETTRSSLLKTTEM